MRRGLTSCLGINKMAANAFAIVLPCVLSAFLDTTIPVVVIVLWIIVNFGTINKAHVAGKMYVPRLKDGERKP
jgi:hypothetical protein